MKSQAFSAERVSVSLHSVVFGLAAAYVVERVKKSCVFLSEGVSPSLHSVVACPASALVKEMAMKSCVVFSEVFVALVLSHVLGLCLFCCAQAFLNVLVTSKSVEARIRTMQTKHFFKSTS